MMTRQYDLFNAEAGRDEAFARLEAHAGDFVELGLCFIAAKLRGQRLTGEDIRRLMTEANIVPHDPHAWGMLTGLAIRRGLLVRTGRRLKMRAVSSHARLTDEYLVM